MAVKDTKRRKRKKDVDSNEIITLENVSKAYSTGAPALNGISLHINRGEFVFIVGDSGSGKSTLIKLLLRELTPTEGSIRVMGYDLNRIRHRKIPEFRRNIGVVFQDFRLLKDLNVYENVAFGLECIGLKKSEIKPKVMDALERVGLKEKARSMPRELSGGEQQRVCIARAIVNEPKLLICDEPTGNLDPETSKEIMKVIYGINKDLGTTVVMATHDRDIVNRMKQRVVMIDAGVKVSDIEKGGYKVNAIN